jgi:hypothetical protein
VSTYPRIGRRSIHPGAVGALPAWLGLAALAGGAYLLVSALGYQVAGFPLDDAWIHQTYARNLATTGQWAFVPGRTSAGSTAPLWSLLLSLGYWLGISYSAWTYALGIAALGLTGWTVSRLGARLFPNTPWVGPLAGLLCVWEWHLVWASVSGMETILYIWLALVLVEAWLIADAGLTLALKSDRLSRQFPALARWWGLGVLGGLLALTRPEGLGLMGLIGLGIGWRLRRVPGRLLSAWAAIGVGLALPLVPYLAFHYATTGLPFPNTFYAKQQEYGQLLVMEPLWRRWLMMLVVTLVGGQLLLLPGFVVGIWQAVSELKSPASDVKRAGGILLVAMWWFTHLSLYALRLPVTYQHGRYQIPVIPFFVLIGVGGSAYLLRLRSPNLVRRVLGRVAMVSIAVLSLAFLGLGARAYASDVAFIQGEMVATARWLEHHVTPGSLIAVHDIGAIGYFTPRPLLDLAGLVTPEVIPFMTDEARLVEYMQQRGADYVVFFPDWSDAYRRMARDPRLEQVYTTNFEWTLQQGQANMTVYRLHPEPVEEQAKTPHLGAFNLRSAWLFFKGGYPR